MTLKIYPVVLELVRRMAPVVRVLRARSAALVWSSRATRWHSWPPSQ
jgi:hypothetical protein